MLTKHRVKVIVSDMSEPWDQTSGFTSRTLSRPYRLMNTSGMAFRDHAGSMVSLFFLSPFRSYALVKQDLIPAASLSVLTHDCCGSFVAIL